MNMAPGGVVNAADPAGAYREAKSLEVSHLP